MNTSSVKSERKKTPAEATPFELNQLRFFLAAGNLGAVLSEANPSLAWLPFLWEAKLVEHEGQLVSWIERNFSDVSAVRDVAANIDWFGPETATFLEFRLHERAPHLPPLLAKCWTLILRHMRSTKRGLAQNEWFQIAPLIKQGQHTADILERLSNSLRPKLKVGKRLSWYGDEEGKPIERPADLMSIDYEVRDSVSSSEVLDAWPMKATAETDEELLRHLTGALNTALADATDAGVEAEEGYSTSDTDVPSVARHRQNEYRSGFQAIVRVMAEIWTRLAPKSSSRSLAVAAIWRNSSYRLTRRLAMFAFANPTTPGTRAADVLIGLPAGELFLTGSSVEAYRLIRERWPDFPIAKQRQILKRICEGPPRTWFREGADIDRIVDRSRYEYLSDMARRGINIGSRATKLLDAIQKRWPGWQPKPAEQIGFHVWHEGGFRARSNSMAKLEKHPDSELVSEAKKMVASAPFAEDDGWHSLCQSNPDRALSGLEAAASIDDWSKEHWRDLLWSRTAYTNSDTETRIAKLLLKCPKPNFSAIAPAASSWLEAHDTTLSESLLWPLWDRVADETLTDSPEANGA